MPAGMLADKFGGKHVFGAGVLVSAVLSLCSPALARISPYAFMAGRVLQGFGQVSYDFVVILSKVICLWLNSWIFIPAIY